MYRVTGVISNDKPLSPHLQHMPGPQSGGVVWRGGWSQEQMIDRLGMTNLITGKDGLACTQGMHADCFLATSKATVWDTFRCTISNLKV